MLRFRKWYSLYKLWRGEHGKIITYRKHCYIKPGNQKLMITSRGSLYNNGGEIGYFEYAACIYPFGQANQQAFFFNHENIKEVIFEGYSDEDEEEYCRMYEKQIQNCNYPRLELQKQVNA